jgi:uncharacterized protein YbjT (DUF2867 family)
MSMQRVLITGATGNIGVEVVRSLCELGADLEVIVAVRNVEQARSKFPERVELGYRTFDFEDATTIDAAFDGIDILFLLRPPHLSNVEKYFEPLLRAARDKQIKRVVFLSVQGAEASKVIPHNKIERAIIAHGFDHIFVRPSYFMQNLTTALLPEILASRSITLPAGSAQFNWVDIRNIGEVVAILIMTFQQHRNKAFDITGPENLSFQEVVTLLSAGTKLDIRYRSIGPVRFYLLKRKQGIPSGFAVVMTILHFLPRFQQEPRISDNFRLLTGKEPTRLASFIEREREAFLRW